ncbi:MAG TPA: ABC transporter permease [Candidatus Saccharimonadales bacterium]|nr:ABC transporter permease [Candidatus Saccharimonadales bacterium]
MVSQINNKGHLAAASVIINQADRPLSSQQIKEIWAYRDLLYFLTWRDVKVRYKQAAMGAAWAVIQPLGMMLVFAVFFGIFVGVPTEGMPHTLFFYCGLMPWMFFAAAVSAGSVSLLGSSNLLTKVYFPRLIVPVAAVAALLIDLVITTFILLSLAFYYGFVWSWHLLMFPLMLVLTIWLALDFSIWLSGLTVKYRDIRHALPFVLQLWMFVTPIIYPLSVVPEKWRLIMYLNPMTGIVEAIRASLQGHEFNWFAILFSVVIALLLLPLALHSFQRVENTFADFV